MTANSSGNILPTHIWSIPPSEPVIHHEYDVVLDKESDGHNTGIYNSLLDGIDSADVVGFTALVTEFTSSAMVLMVITVIFGYVRNREGKGR
ncbi:MAG: hypothetical protein SVJ22_09130 [Halobacteriota archaeon]|nr:hypothetical protein [Halobacteriota archaeon]